MDPDPRRLDADGRTPDVAPGGDPDTTRTDPLRDDTVDAAAGDAATRPAAAFEPQRTADVARPSGPSWPTVVLGLVAAAVGGLVLAAQVVDLDVDWSVTTPAVVVAAGGVLVVLGVLALVRRRDEPGSG